MKFSPPMRDRSEPGIHPSLVATGVKRTFPGSERPCFKYSYSYIVPLNPYLGLATQR